MGYVLQVVKLAAFAVFVGLLAAFIVSAHLALTVAFGLFFLLMAFAIR